MTKEIKKIYKFILKYFYSWYILPMVLLHESCHIIVGKILGYKILNKGLIPKTDFLPLINGYVTFKYKKYSWKSDLVNYAPLLLLLPVLFMFLNTILYYMGLYIISTIIIFEKQIIWLCIPSKSDVNYKNKLKYFEYIINKTSEKVLNSYLKENNLEELIKKYHLINENEFNYKKN